jgi:hypothetical protein
MAQEETSELGLHLVGTVAVMVNAFETGALSEVDLYQAIEIALDEYIVEREVRRRADGGHGAV